MMLCLPHAADAMLLFFARRCHITLLSAYAMPFSLMPFSPLPPLLRQDARRIFFTLTPRHTPFTDAFDMAVAGAAAGFRQ